MDTLSPSTGLDQLAVLPLCSPGLPRYSGRSRGAREGWEVEEGVPGSSPRSLASPRWMSGQAREVFVEMVALLGVVAVAVEEEEGRRAGPGEAGGVAVRGGGEAARRADTWPCSRLSWSFCQANTCNRSGWRGESEGRAGR